MNTPITDSAREILLDSGRDWFAVALEALDLARSLEHKLSTERDAREDRISELEAECQNHVEHIAPLRQRMETAEARVAQLEISLRDCRNYIRSEGILTDTCTFNILREICEGCRCERAPQRMNP